MYYCILEITLDFIYTSINTSTINIVLVSIYCVSLAPMRMLVYIDTVNAAYARLSLVT